MLRIALAQVNATVGDLDGNAGLIVEWTRRAAERGARVVVFPEMMLTGYPVEDLALRASFVEASIAGLHAVAARLAAEGLGGIAVVNGYLDRRADLAPVGQCLGRIAPIVDIDAVLSGELCQSDGYGGTAGSRYIARHRTHFIARFEAT